MSLSTRHGTFVGQSLAKLAKNLGFHPVEMVCTDLEPYRQFTPNVVIRENPTGYWHLMMLFECTSAEELAAHAEKVVRFADLHPKLSRDRKLRICCVGIGPPGLSRRQCRRHLKPVRMHSNHIVVRRFWVSLDNNRMFAFNSPWGIAPAFEINPCDPDDNVFVELVRGNRYLESDDSPGVTEDFHRMSIARERSFLAGLSGGRRFVHAIFALNLLIWLVMHHTGGSTNAAQLVRAGAKVNGLIIAGQYWRFVTPIFLHYGLMHLALNSAGLLIFGEILNRIYGPRQFGLLYVVAGIASVITSFIFGVQIMVGASGAIFGLAGALVLYGYRYRFRIPLQYKAMCGGGLLPLIGLNLLFGAMIKRIDNWAHVGGLVVGTALALTLKPIAERRTRPSTTSIIRLSSLLAFGLVLGAIVVAGWNFTWCGNIFETDTQWVLAHEIPGGADMTVPASWMQTVDKPTAAVFQSPVIPGCMLEARAIDSSKGIRPAFYTELARLHKDGFRVPIKIEEGFDIYNPDAWTRENAILGILSQLYDNGRVQVRMPGGKGRLRDQVFLLRNKQLISVGVQFPERFATHCAPMIYRMLNSLPAPTPTGQ